MTQTTSDSRRPGLLSGLCGVVRCDGAMAALLPVAEQTREIVLMGVATHPSSFVACLAAATIGGMGSLIRNDSATLARRPI